MLKRTIWHSAQHARYLASFLEQRGTESDRPLLKTYLQGLPLTDMIWEEAWSPRQRAGNAPKACTARAVIRCGIDEAWRVKMATQAPKKIFVSYSHADDDACNAVFTHLQNLKHLDIDVDVWIDRDKIRAGDLWHPHIDQALDAADLAVLLISSAFLASDFIKRHELPHLRERHDRHGMRIIPILLKPCAWQSIAWLSATDIRPHGDHALSELGDIASSKVDRALGNIINNLADILRKPVDKSANRTPTTPTTPTTPPADASISSQEALAAVALVRDTVLRGIGEQARETLARTLVERVRQITKLSDEGVFNGVRFCVEYHLLNADDLVSPLLLKLTTADSSKNEDVDMLVKQLIQRSKHPDFGQEPIEVTTKFFARTREREDDWKNYFDALVATGLPALEPLTLTTLCTIRVLAGYLSPQYLVAGLMSRFNDDWRPVLNAYQRAIPDPKLRAGAFESLQASQWNCWLVWGPSVPICRCAMWSGAFALQFGYGDENNSLPLIELQVDESSNPRTLGPLAAGLGQERRHARPLRLSGRLRWGPWFLRADDGEPADDSDDMEKLDRLTNEPLAGKIGAALAQASLFSGKSLAHRHHTDGLVFQFDRLDHAARAPHTYFSAYLWVMFLVAARSTTPGGVPRLLRGKSYPAWPENEMERARVRDARLWEDLLPVFVHANIADANALDFQKRALVDNALQLLRQVWTRRAEMFHQDDVAQGIQFHLVSASDYTGCGCEVRYPSGDRLRALMHQRITAEADQAFASAIVVPAIAVGDEPRADELAGYFSTCHLPELVGDYYAFVATTKPVEATGRRR